MKERLLKRIRRWSTEEQSGLHEIAGPELVESIRADLELLFNTRRGTVLVDDDLGLPDLTHLTNGYGQPEVDDLTHELVTQIKRYEPRLAGVDVRYVGDQGKQIQLAFNVTADIRQQKQTIPFSMKIVMNENGSTSVMR